MSTMSLQRLERDLQWDLDDYEEFEGIRTFMNASIEIDDDVQNTSSFKAEKVVVERKGPVILTRFICDMVKETPESLKELDDLLHPENKDFESSVSVRVKGRNLFAPFLYAVAKGLPKVTQMLLEIDANQINALGPCNITPAHIAAYAGSEKCLQKLLEFGADVNVRTSEILFFRKMSGELETYSDAVDDNSVEGRKFLVVEEVCGLGTKFIWSGSTPLHLAAQGNHIECVKLLIDQGVDLNTADSMGHTALFLAAEKGLPECVMTILQYSAGFPVLSIPTDSGDTALHKCLRGGEKMTGCIKELVRHGADVSLSNMIFPSPLTMAIAYSWGMDIIEMLILEGHTTCRRRGAEADYLMTPLREALQWRETEERWRCMGRGNPSRVSHYESVAMLCIRLGEGGKCLEDFLAVELEYDRPGSPLFNTLMDSFAYLPHFPGSVEDCLRASSRSKPQVAAKYSEFIERRKEVPLLSHLSRMVIRRNLQGDVVKVTSFPVPTSVKRYILLDHPL